MSDAHRKAFVAESEEGITELNNALLDLEADPDDDEAMDSIFRIAHTLKGNASAMGYESVAELAHEMEDLLDEVREGDIPVDTELMDLLFDSVDYLDAMVGDIAEDGETDIDASGVEADLREKLETGSISGGGGGGGTPDEPAETDDADEDAADADDTDDTTDDTAEEPDDEDAAEEETGDEEAEDDAAEPAESGDSDDADGEPATADADGAADAAFPESLADVELDTGEAVYRATVGLGETEMPGVEAIFIMQEIDGSYDTIATQPDRDTIEDGDFEDTFDIFVIDTSGDEIEGILGGLGKVDSATVSPVTVTASDPISAAEAAEQAGTITDSGDDDESEADDGDEASDDSEVDDSDDSDSSDDSSSSSSSSSSGGRSGPSSGGRSGPSSSGSDDADIQSVRVDVNQLDELYNLVEQLVTSRIKLRREMEREGIDSDNLDELDKITGNLQDTAMDMRLIPLSKIVDTFPRLVRDVARETGKEVNFTVTGEDIELDRTILTEIRDPLIHVLRNAVDHGIEPPEEREANGKERTGNVSLTATRDRDHVNIEVADDGAGLDPEMLKEKAIEKGVKTETELEQMDDGEIYELIFHPGFSTAEEVTDVSGRGVGMDVVQNTVKQLDGTINVDSELGEGTVVTLRLPVTVAIVKVMFVEVGGTEYGIPVKNIAEVTRATDIRTTKGDEIIEHDDQIYPILRLSDALDEPSSVNGDGMLLRIRDEHRQVALHCDKVIDQEEVVVKPLEGVLSGIPGLSGTAVLGDGDVVAVLDVVTL
ncbi:chemotaxis protein CheA [Halonotius terrestris]|uniref:Chemotaxis protein CheA n=1 Tax=Halonotius terrestris TaxID=2487750 RepID=A0A8J8P9L9_9EURY|nr:chemotaxis protein CheA [Halonotius terrestris]TQQ81281.1 chemotaxis protein CheA [Halonotius terrestris]